MRAEFKLIMLAEHAEYLRHQPLGIEDRQGVADAAVVATCAQPYRRKDPMQACVK
jgi:hypothetical protein